MFNENAKSIAEALESKTDDELQALMDQCQNLLASRDRERKEKAFAEAQRIAAEAGLQITKKKTRKYNKRKTRTGDDR